MLQKTPSKKKAARGRLVVKFDILTLFPNYFVGPFNESMIKRAQDKGILQIECTDIREFAEDKHNRVDDRPYGGGPGMVMKAGPVLRALRSIRSEKKHVIYLSPQGTPLTAKRCSELATHPHLVLLSGHYEGIDERVLDEVDEEISIGDYVLPGGGAAAVVVVEAVARFLPHFLGDPQAAVEDSFQEGIFDHPHYTRPEVFEGKQVPGVLLGGDPKKIRAWRKNEALKKTAKVRPDLYNSYLNKEGR